MRTPGDGLSVGGVLLTVGYAPTGRPRAQRLDVARLARAAAVTQQLRLGRKEGALRRAHAAATTPTAEARLAAAVATVRAQAAAWQAGPVEARLRAALGRSRDPDRVVALGLNANLVVTTGLGFVVDAWQGSVELETLKYHATGAGDTSPAGGQTNLITPHTTETDPSNTRATGTLGEGASAVIFRTTATVTLDEATDLKEWGLFSNATVGMGVMGARALTPVVAIGGGDLPFEVDFEYEVTLAAA